MMKGCSPLGIPTIKTDTKYSYADYLQWEGDQRWELIDGVPYNMSPAPSPIHQEVSISISSFFYHYLFNKNCRVYVAPFDVRLSETAEEDQEIYNVVQPDISIICDPQKIDKRGCKGAPDLVIEILSPGTGVKRDKINKFHLYEKYRVREYWIVNPDYQTVEVYILQQDHFGREQLYTKDDVVEVSIFEDCRLDLSHVFRDTFI
jgi:Uma2 family endonuclease